MDWKTGDVNGDGVLDTVYLYGQLDGSPGIYADNITLVIKDGWSNKSTSVQLENNAGYNARLFLGDFDQNNIADIMVSIDTGGSGGYGLFYIYSFRDNLLQEIFNVDKYNYDYAFEVNYADYYKVRVESARLNLLFIIDVSEKGLDYLSQYYDKDGLLIKPVQGEVLDLGALNPIITNTPSYNYDLLALQRIIGTTNADTLGYVENLLTWEDTQLVSRRLVVSIFGGNLT